MARRAVLLRALVAIAVGKAALGLVAAAIAAAARDPQMDARFPLLIATATVFSATGVWLVVGGARDPRAFTLGALFLAIASAFADPLVRHFSDWANSWAIVAPVIMALQVDALAPYLLWSFAREFPRLPDARADRQPLVIAALRASASVGALLIIANVLLFVSTLTPLPLWMMATARHFARHGNAGLYWPLVLGLCLPVLPLVIWKAQQAGAAERRRVALLVAGLVAGLVPTITWVFLQGVSPSIARVLPLRVVGWVTYPTLLATPIFTAYAVLVRRALDVRVVVRRALQYALARYTAIVAAAIPVLMLSVSLYQRRHETIAKLASTPSQLVLAVIAVLGLITLRRRNQVLVRIDRLFFREQYDTQHILGELVNRCRVTEDRRQLAETLRATLDSALHLDTVTVLFVDDAEEMLASPEGEIRPLRIDSAIADLVRRSATIDFDLERRNPLFRDIPETELHWIVDGGFRLIASLRDSERRLIGLLALGEKKSELPFSAEDHRLLAGVASAAEMTMAFRNVGSRHSGESALLSVSAVADQVAAECQQCGSVQPPDRGECVRCGGDIKDCVLPQVVGGKFLIDERIGAGAMGVVYRGMDVHLGRLVAIKTLPHLSPGEAVRLRREARAMASVSHRNLATIFGAETWLGRPMLVCEYLPGGTLADRLARAPLSLHDMIDTGLALCSVLAAIHRAGVLHRDIKPSNIGFSAEGTPKLLDFGIARILTAVSSPAAAVSGTTTGMRDDELSLAAATESAIRGTPLYMSPEALMADPPDPSFDLWSLAMVLYEAVVGRHPLLSDDPVSNARPRRRGPDVPEICVLNPVLPTAVGQFFRRALAPSRGDRPQTAEELHAMLAVLSEQISESVRIDPAILARHERYPAPQPRAAEGLGKR